MSETEQRRPGHVIQPPRDASCKKPNPDAVLCERCNVEMFRMHAVWRCPNCGFKTDCCGW